MKHKRQAAAVLACTLALGLGATAGARSMYPIFINGEETELAGNTVSGITHHWPACAGRRAGISGGI